MWHTTWSTSAGRSCASAASPLAASGAGLPCGQMIVEGTQTRLGDALLLAFVWHPLLPTVYKSHCCSFHTCLAAPPCFRRQPAAKGGALRPRRPRPLAPPQSFPGEERQPSRLGQPLASQPASRCCPRGAAAAALPRPSLRRCKRLQPSTMQRRPSTPLCWTTMQTQSLSLGQRRMDEPAAPVAGTRRQLQQQGLRALKLGATHERW